MSYSLEDKLVVGIATRALFDLEDSNRVFETEGLAAYREYQQAREGTPLGPGTAFDVIRGLLGINRRAGKSLVEVIVMSRNDAESAVRVFNSIAHYRLPIERGVFRSGRDPWPYLAAFNCSLFLSVDSKDVVQALEAGVPAALVLAPPDSTHADEEDTEVRIALDGDAVLFGDESEFLYQTFGLDEFHRHETEQVAVPMSPGPLEPFLRALHRLQAEFPEGESPIRTALVTSRNAQALMRVINTLRSWGVHIDETFSLGGIDKTEVLGIFRPHIFFDDQMAHLESARRVAPSAQVPRRVTQLEAFGDMGEAEARMAPLVVVPPVRSPKAAPRPRSPKATTRTARPQGRGATAPQASALDLDEALPKR
ncbi:MAG TPA: 5'-nucleotidase [Candidatus Limnocylindria bacterium]|nr:5'-nucleotidase [Candidatus Limnocylindria bacterium]